MPSDQSVRESVPLDTPISDLIRISHSDAEARVAELGARAAALASAPAAAADIAALATAFGIAPALAERELRKAGGDYKAAVAALLRPEQGM
jgi:hypothetical protein